MKLLQIDDFLKNKVIRNLEINERETHCAYFENALDIDTNHIKSKLVLFDLNEKTSDYILNDLEPYGFFFNKDFLMLKVKKENQSYLYSYDLKTKGLAELISFPFDLKDTFVGTDQIYFAADIQQNDKKMCASCSEKGPYYLEGVGVRGERITGLFKSSMDGKDIKIITSLDMNVDQVDFDADNDRIVFTVFKTAQLKPVESDVYTYDMATGLLTKYTNGQYRVGFVKSMTEDAVIFTGTDMRSRSRNDNQQLYKIDISSGSFKQLGKHIDKSNEICAVITDSSCSTSKPIMKYDNAFYHIRVEHDGDVIYKTTLDGLHEIIKTGLKKIDSYIVHKKGILICGLKDLDLHELYWYHDGMLTALTTNNKWLDDYTLSMGERQTILDDGQEIEGYVFKPTTFEVDGKYPAIMAIHGGPKMIFANVFMHDVQVLCAKGYFVYIVNPIGSDGRGDVFSDIRGRMLCKPYDQLMQFTDAVINRYPQVNENALGVMGGSYGGLMTNYIITQTKRFGAAMSERGISSMVTSFTSSDIGYKFLYEYMGNDATPWEDPDKYVKASPIMYANQVSTPTLFIHGKCDYRCHYTESLNMYAALNYLGVPSKFCLFEGENHGLPGKGKPQSRKKRYQEIVSWFDNHLKEEKSNGLG